MISRQAPERAITARFGGEEFVLFLPDTNAAEAAQIADTLRESFTLTVGAKLQLSRALTASFGLSTVQGSDGSIHDAIARADEALYEAKARGRNRVCVRRTLSSPDTMPASIPRTASA